jgi:predicted anti-sigma-YlaC factor YlaD
VTVKTERVKICNTPECRRMRALLSDFLDHSLHWRTSRSLEAHLEACPPCRVYVSSIETTILLYRERPVVDVPAAVRGHLRELLRERHENSPKKRAGRCCAEAVRRTVRTSPAKTAKKTATKS